MSGGTGRTGLTLVGQVVGSYFGPIGAAVGGMIGSAIGGAIWPEQLEGPKLEGLQVTSSAYGGPLGKVYGAYRVPGNIIWASEIREVARTEQQGKGGGPEITTYEYFVDVAIAVGEGPIIGVRSIWADQKLIYDVGSDDIASIIASFARGGEGMRFYAGDESQLPDPTIEAAKGVGNATAYRGVAYVVFENFSLSAYGNRTPNFNFEVIGGGTDAGPRVLFGRSWTDVGVPSTGLRIADARGELVTLNGAATVGWVSDFEGDDVIASAPGVLPPWPSNFTDVGAGSFGSLLLWSSEEGGPSIYTVSLAATNSGSPVTVINASSLDEYGNTEAEGTSFADALSDGGQFLYAVLPCVDRIHVLSLLDDAGASELPTYWILFRFDEGVFVEVDRGPVNFGDIFYRTGGAMSSQGGSSFSYSGAMLEADLTHVWFATSAGTREVLLGSLESGELTEIASFTLTSPYIQAFGRVGVFANNGVCYVSSVDSESRLFAFTRSPDYSIDVTLADVVSDLCLSSGLESGDINVTDLESTIVRGYFRSPRMSARAAIEPLMVGYAFDGVESDDKLRFVMRDATPIVTIPQDDLGAGRPARDSLVESDRAQESELPLMIDVTYLSVDAGYQLGTQSFKRQAVTSVDQQSIRLQLALEDQEASEIAARMMFELWLARMTRNWSTPVKYTKYEPTDVVSIEGDSATYTSRITSKVESGNLILWQGVDVDAAAFIPTNTATTVPGGQTVTPLAGLTHLIAGDLPPLRESDFGNTGYYAAAAGFSATWPGATLFRKPAEGSTYSQELIFLTRATIGVTLDALDSHADPTANSPTFGGYSTDHCNQVTVALTAGTLSSCTHAEFLNMQNVALVGNEIIAFRDVEDLGGGQYRLSCLLRGLQGTEWFAALEPATNDATYIIVGGIAYTFPVETVQGHRVGDRFMLLDTTFVQRFDSGSTTARVYGNVAGVTAGDTLANTGKQWLDQTYASIVQPAPSHLVAYLDDNGDMVLDFAPRTFIDGGWNDGRDAWLDPTHQEYIVEARNISSEAYYALFTVAGTPPFLVPAEDFATAIGDAGLPISVRVGATPRQMPGFLSEAFGALPEMANRHYSRKVVVS